MPTSKSNLIHPLLRILTRVRPGSALDVGVGFGKFAFLAREYLDVRDAKSDIDRYRREKWKTRIDGVEIFKAYITELHRHLYNQIHIGDIVELLPTLPRYDFIWIGDAIEHIEKTRATGLIDRLIEKSDRMFGLTTPYGDTEQEALYGDPYERHISGWTARRTSNAGRKESCSSWTIAWFYSSSRKAPRRIRFVESARLKWKSTARSNSVRIGG